MKDNFAVSFLVTDGSDARRRDCVENAKYEGKNAGRAAGNQRGTKEEGRFSGASVNLAGVILILAPNNCQNLFTSY